MRTLMFITVLNAVASSVHAQSDARSRLIGDVHGKGVYSSGARSSEFEDEDRSGLGVGGSLAWDRDKRDDHFRVAISSDYFHYSEDGRDDRWTKQLLGSYGRDLGKRTTVSLIADYTDDQPALERSTVDQMRVRGRVQYETGSNRLRLTGGWRWRGYDDRDNTDGHGPALDLNYRYMFGKTKTIGVITAYDEITADVESRSYRRYSVFPYARFEVDDRTDIELGVRYRHWEYPDRPVGSSHEKNTDKSVELSISRDLGKRWYAVVDGRVGHRRSNNDSRDEDIARAQLTIGKRFSVRL